MAQAKAPKKPPSSSTAGFFQEPPQLRSQFDEDVALRRAFECNIKLTLNPGQKVYLTGPAQTSTIADLSRFGALVLSPGVAAHLASAERDLPSLETWDTFGRRADTLHTSEGWRALQRLGHAEGIVALAYERAHGAQSRTHQFLKYHLWTGSCAVVTCPSAMQDGAAALLERHLASSSSSSSNSSSSSSSSNQTSNLEPILRSALTRLTSRNPDLAWTSGQWMTERPGGSDVRNTETRAELVSDSPGLASDGSPLGPYRITGFKWFSSAIDADMAVLLAKTGDGDDELSAFFAPLRRYKPGSTPSGPNPPSATKDSPALELNGIQIQRLKRKLGTRALPTAELVLHDMRAHALGPTGAGTKEISAVLTITRVHTAVSAMGMLGRGLAVSRAFSRVRRAAGGALLCNVPAHVRGLADAHVEYRAHMHLVFFAVACLGVTEQSEHELRLLRSRGQDHQGQTPSQSQSQSRSQDLQAQGHQEHASQAHTQVPEHLQLSSPTHAAALLRILTPVVKARASLCGASGLRFAMESLGGVGYLENEDVLLNVARLVRDVNVLSIWEGTTDVLGADLVRVLRSGGQGHSRSSSTPNQNLNSPLAALDDWINLHISRWQVLRSSASSNTSSSTSNPSSSASNPSSSTSTPGSTTATPSSSNLSHVNPPSSNPSSNPSSPNPSASSAYSPSSSSALHALLDSATDTLYAAWSSTYHFIIDSSSASSSTPSSSARRMHNQHSNQLLYHSRPLLARIAWSVAAVLLVSDALRDCSAVAIETARRYVHSARFRAVDALDASCGIPGELDCTRGSEDDDDDKGAASSWFDAAAWDRKIVFGDEPEEEVLESGRVSAKL